MAVIDSPADVVNLALVRVGSKWLIGNIYDGSDPAQLALAIYGQTRDDLLRKLTPQFAQRQVALTLLKQAPDGGYVDGWNDAYPALPWTYEYAYPDDMLKLGSVRPTPLFIPNYDPQPNNFSTPNDMAVSGATAKVILTDVPGAVATYTARVTNPTQWEAEFIDTMASELGKLLAPALDKLEAAKMQMAEEPTAEAADKMTQG